MRALSSHLSQDGSSRSNSTSLSSPASCAQTGRFDAGTSSTGLTDTSRGSFVSPSGWEKVRSSNVVVPANRLVMGATALGHCRLGRTLFLAFFPSTWEIPQSSSLCVEFRGVLVCRLSLRCWETTRYPIFRSRLTQRVVGRRRRISTGDKGKVFSHPSNKNYTDTRAFRRFLRFHTSRTRSEEKKNVNNDGRLEGSVTPVGPIEDSSRTNGIKLKEEDLSDTALRV